MATALLMPLVADQARAESLTIGSPAPAIDIEHWFHDHESITAFEAGKVYVVEFWATWCGPCVASMPHLAEIQKKYADDLVVISVSTEPPETIEEFLERKKRETTFREITSAYRLATDPDRSVSNDYMRAAGQNGIPTAFLVGKTGQIEWIGHPMRMDEPVAKVIAGEWDRASFLAELEEEKMVRTRTQRLGRLAQQNKFTEALADLDALLAEVKSERVRQGLVQGRRRLLMQADTHAEQQRRDAERAEMAGKAEARIVSQLIDIAFLLDAGKRDEASTVLTKMLAEAKAPQVQALLQQALKQLEREVDLAVETE